METSGRGASATLSSCIEIVPAGVVLADELRGHWQGFKDLLDSSEADAKSCAQNLVDLPRHVGGLQARPVVQREGAPLKRKNSQPLVSRRQSLNQ